MTSTNPSKSGPWSGNTWRGFWREDWVKKGAKFEEHTKQLKVIPVGVFVAVQNQKGRFPKKWDKTGTMMENMDHNMVLVRLDDKTPFLDPKTDANCLELELESKKILDPETDSFFSWSRN